MTAQRFAESVVEDAALAWLEALGYGVLHGPDIAIGELAAERSDPNYRDVVLESRSLFQYGMSLNGASYFQRGMSLKASFWVDHRGHGDRHERNAAQHGGAITRLSRRHA